ncbi:MAG: endopeptidase La [Treponema sp.]|nr:endopeptidase La [Treponema sp.]
MGILAEFLGKVQGAEEYPLLPLRELVIFPQTAMSVYITYKSGIFALEEALKRGTKLFAACIKDAQSGETYDSGTVVRIVQNLRLPDNTFRVVLQGEYRAFLVPSRNKTDPALVRVEPIAAAAPQDITDAASLKDVTAAQEVAALMRAVQKSFAQFADYSKKISTEILSAVEKTDSPERLVNVIGNILPIKPERKVDLIRIADPSIRLETLLEILEMENEIFGIQRNISGKVKSRMDKNQREFILHEQLREINKELGKDAANDEFAEMERNIENRKPGEEVMAKARKEIARLRKLQPFSPEAGVLRGYLEWIADLPWSEYSQDSTDLNRAETILNEDHYGMKKAKERIIEFIAVRQLSALEQLANQAPEKPPDEIGETDVSSADAEEMGTISAENEKTDDEKTDTPSDVAQISVKGPILCFVGPPGTGKTSLGKSVARSLGRKFARISLGGVRDEAEIRGHRKTYVGALPGKILQSMRKTGTLNPVLLLDEIDKLAHDARGDPASALLEVLDPEQNSTFTDHYLEVPYDLSKVLFITTANSLHSIPHPLLDRMEIIEIPGYGENEKLAIAQKYLVPKELQENGLSQAKIVFTDEVVREIIRHWTSESGVRSLEREIARCIRRIARHAVNKDYGKSEGKPIRSYKKTVRQNDLEKLLGRRKYKNDVVFKEARTGVSYGLAWTETGGTMLPVETIQFKGSGDCIITGNLGGVMKESVRIALSFLRSVRERYSFGVADMGKTDFHIHVPEGAIPKDGPSAGVTLAASLLSTLCNVPPKPAIAMTGELTLTGRILPIGGLKEKLLAAIRNNMEEVLLPEDNREDWQELDDDIKNALTVHFVENAVDAFDVLFGKGIAKKSRKKATTVKKALVEKKTPEKKVGKAKKLSIVKKTTAKKAQKAKRSPIMEETKLLVKE